MAEREDDAQFGSGIPALAAAFEGALAIVAIGLGWLFGVRPTETIEWSLSAIGWGLLATLPMLVQLWVCVKIPWRPFENIGRAIDDTLAPLLRHCSLIDLAAVSLLAGLGEELLFRGFLQQLVAGWIGGAMGIWVGLGAASVAFGLLHAITPTYAVVAGLIGLFLGWLWIATGNLLAPITAHAVYDFLALVYFMKIRPPKGG